MPIRAWRIPRPLEIVAVLLLLAGLFGSGLSGWPFWVTASGVLLTVSAAVLRPRGNTSSGDDAERLQKQVDDFESLRDTLSQQFADREARLAERERDLVHRCSRVQELLDYPTEDVHLGRETAELTRLTEQDQAVRQLLESEAERVYEKIRRNGYSTEGALDVVAIRTEAHELVRQIARIYSPDSKQPLMETSFEQLARAASRICLHVLVLLEQLPLNVQKYNFNSLYGYFRKAVVGYGAFQKASPWFKGLSRGIYAGRMVSMTNPLSLGAWWLASELGRKGTQKLVENVIDRQAVSVLHDLVTVIGVEVACVYGKGFRQRDPAWILGTELVELVRQFPLSRESLRAGLQAVTALPLRNEYDRIYLYRCLANHRSAGHHLADPAMLTRGEREAIAMQLEKFFAAHIHGATAENSTKWRTGFEERFDLRLKLAENSKAVSASHSALAEDAAQSLAGFLRSIASADNQLIAAHLPLTRIWQQIPEVNRAGVLERLSRLKPDHRFVPPGLEPMSSITDAFLADLATVCVRYCGDEPHVEQLVVETGAYFRRTLTESQQLVDSQWLAELRSHSVSGEIHSELTSSHVKAILRQRQPAEMVAFAFPDVSVCLTDDETKSLAETWLIGMSNPADQSRRTLLISATDVFPVLWHCEGKLTVTRERGLLIDSAAVGGGQWTKDGQQTAGPQANSSTSLIVSGSLRGGRFRNYFRSLLEFGE